MYVSYIFEFINLIRFKLVNQKYSYNIPENFNCKILKSDGNSDINPEMGDCATNHGITAAADKNDAANNYALIN